MTGCPEGIWISAQSVEYRLDVQSAAVLFFCQNCSLVGKPSTPLSEKALPGSITCPKKLKRLSIMRMAPLSEKLSARKDAGTMTARIPRGLSSFAAFRQ